MTGQSVPTAGGYGVVGRRIAVDLARDYQAIATVCALMEGEVSEPGVWMPEQVIDPSGFFSQLARHGLTVALQRRDTASGVAAQCDENPRSL